MSFGNHFQTICKAIVKAICEHPNTQGKTKLIVFDCCREGNSLQMLDIPDGAYVAFSTKVGTGSWIYGDRGCAFTHALAEKLEAKARTHDVDSIFLELRHEGLNANAAVAAQQVPLNQAPPVMSSLSERVLLA